MKTDSYQNRLDGLRDLALLAIRDDTVKSDGFNVLQGCQNVFHGNGALNFILQLMAYCKSNQINDIVWLIEECMPIMPTFFMEKILNGRFYMHLRHEDILGFRKCLEVTARKWKEKGLVRHKYLPSFFYQTVRKNYALNEN